ncbi:MAG TPA: pyridoxal phosphate-dependent aminotransferase [Geminicoccaceae bacterium]|nr:pyridoxal phosphate-dependent aminotransferase [Geminicoccaceae bacterium]
MLKPAPSASTGPIADLRRAIASLPSSKIREVAHLGMGRDDVIPLWFGESDLPTPQFICDAVARALAAGDTFYQPNAGIAELRTALADYMNRLYGTRLSLHNVIVSASAMNALMLAMQSLVDPGDVVVTTTPAWPNLPAVPRILTGAIREVPLSPGNAGWRLDLDRLLDACDARTRVIFLNSPNNPTGWLMSAEQQNEVLDFARRRGIWIVSDEVYARIVYDRPVAPSFLEQAQPDDRLIVVNSFSKTWSMTGWRLGWLTMPAELAPTFEMLTEYNIAGPAGFIQRAGVVAVREGEPCVRETVERYRAARDLVVERMARIPGTSLPTPEAAFYAFLRIEGMADSVAFAKELLARTGVGLAPGAAFGDHSEDCLRLCFAASLPKLADALDRIEGFMRSR